MAGRAHVSAAVQTVGRVHGSSRMCTSSRDTRAVEIYEDRVDDLAAFRTGLARAAGG
ncbi:MAG: hypothetical protein ACXWYP_06525 [Pseudonocardia sp.]